MSEETGKFAIYSHMETLASKYGVPGTWVGALWEYLYRPSLVSLENVIRGYSKDFSEEEYDQWLSKHFKERWLINAESLCS